MRKYDNYIDSNIEWLGDIPAHWTLTKNKRVLNLLTDFTANGSFGDLAKNVQYLDSGYARLVRLTDLRLNLNNSGLYVSKYSYEYLKKSSLRGGELVVANVGANVGTVCIVPETDEIKTLGPNMFLVGYKNILNKKYIFYLLCSDFLQYEFKVVATTTAQPKLNKDQFRSLNITIPPISEQQAIANYLDAKTQAIDKKVALLEQKIETYKKLKRTLINQTITKGLDKNAPLKDSGISWIGQIPQHWEVKRLRDIAKIQTGNTPLTSDKLNYSESGIPWVKPNNLNDLYPTYSTDGFISEYGTKSIRLIKKDSVMVCCIGSIGKMGVAGVDLCTNQQINSITFKNIIKPDFGKYLIFISKDEHIRNSTGNVLAILNTDNQSRIKFAYTPDLSEQEEIATYIDHKTATIDAIVGNISKQIETLKQLRKTLINDVVTGKIKVIE